MSASSPEQYQVTRQYNYSQLVNISLEKQLGKDCDKCQNSTFRCVYCDLKFIFGKTG